MASVETNIPILIEEDGNKVPNKNIQRYKEWYNEPLENKEDKRITKEVFGK